MRWLAILVLLWGCGDDAQPSPAPDAAYTVRGRIADITGSEMSLQHEAIPTFRNRAGDTVGMETMTMAFHRPDSVALDGLGIDDLVEVTFEVRWNGDHVMTISAVRALPADADLSL